MDTTATPSVRGEDGSHQPFNMVMVDGALVSSPPELGLDMAQHLKDVKNMEIRDNDVLLCAFPKAGTHWTWEMASMLLRARADHAPWTKGALMLEYIPVSDVDKMASPRVLNTHLLFRHLPRQCLEKRTKIIYVTRNPKDVSVSFFHHFKSSHSGADFKGPFSEYLRQFVLRHDPAIGNNCFMVRDWEKEIESHPDHPILHLRYEDMREDLTSQVCRLAEFLEVDANEELVQKVTDACSFANMKSAEKTKKHPLAHLFLEGYSMYRKGEVGDWKNWFTVADNELFDEYYKTAMKDSKLKFRYTL